MSGGSEFDLTGEWTGIYSYPAHYPPNTFEASIRDIGVFSERWPEAVQSLISGRYPMEAYGDLLLGRSSGIKNVIQLN